jgi:hypothetical protein
MGQSEDLALCVVQKERDRRLGRRTSLVYAPRIYAQIIGVVLIMVGVVGCGAGGGGGAEDAQAPSGAKESVVKTIRVKETEFVLKPAEITLEKPGTYLFKAVNSGGTVHALEVEGQGWHLRTLLPGGRSQGRGYGGQDHSQGRLRRLGRLLIQSPSSSCPYSPECVEGEFSEVELPIYGVLVSFGCKLEGRSVGTRQNCHKTS